VKSPSRPVTFLYRSIPVPDETARWETRLHFPADAVPETVLTFEVTDWKGTPIPKGSMELFGKRLRFKDGKGKTTYGTFLEGMRETRIWLGRPDRPPVPGVLTFG